MAKKLSVAALFAALLLAGGAVTYAQSTSPSGGDAEAAAHGITFPVPELGNCASKGECKSYCNDPVHADACVAFAEAHGLMNKTEAAQAKKFAQAVGQGGPGGCRTPGECEQFCGSVANLEACVTFANKQGIKNDQVSQGEKLLKFMKSGGQTPGGCQSEQECRTYCGDFSHAEECFNFAKKAGISQGGGPRGGSGGLRQDEPSPEQFQKFIELAKQGQTPGGCTSKEQCESYCQNSAHAEECTTFGEKVGFISHEEASRMRETGGKGPGGCDSPHACEQFCNDPAHSQECFDFGATHGFISKEEVQRVKEGVVQMRAGIEHAPAEVAACLKSALGQEVLDGIQSGKLTPGPEIGNNMRGCFEKFGAKGSPQEIFKQAPPEVTACLKEKLGETFSAIQNGKQAPTPEMADTFRVCSQRAQFEKGFGAERGGPQGPGGEGGPGAGGPPPQAIQNFIRTAPPGIAGCLKDKLGDNFAKIQAGEALQGFDTSVMKSCFEQFQPQDHPGFEGTGPKEGSPQGQGFGPGGIPREILSCVKEKTGEDVAEEKLRANTGDQGNLGQAIRECFGKMPGKNGRQENFPQGRPEGMPPAMPESRSGSGGAGPALPAAVISCVKEKAGEAVDEEKLRRGERPSPEVEKAVGECFGKINGARPQPLEGQSFPAQPPFPGQGMNPSPQFPAGMPRPGGEGMNGPIPGGSGPQQFPRALPIQPLPQAPINTDFKQQPQFPPPAEQTPPPAPIPAPVPPPTDGGQVPPPQSSNAQPSLLGTILSPFVNLLNR